MANFQRYEAAFRGYGAGFLPFNLAASPGRGRAEAPAKRCQGRVPAGPLGNADPLPAAPRVIRSRPQCGARALRHIAPRRILPGLTQPRQSDGSAMKCKLADAQHKMWPGRTFFTTSNDGEMLPTAVYMPPNHIEAARILNVLLYFHGWYVGSQHALINTDKSRLCEQVINSGRDVVLVAPWLGSKSAKGDGQAFHTDLFGQAGYGERFLKAILDALGAAISASAAPRKIRDVDAISAVGPSFGPFRIKNLVIACHSGGGVAMRNVVQTLGQFESSLRECIGLDCLYDDGDAKFWFDRARKRGTPLAYFVFGPSTRRGIDQTLPHGQRPGRRSWQ